VTIYP